MISPLCLFRFGIERAWVRKPSQPLGSDKSESIPFLFDYMIIFNTIKKAEHYVKFCNKNHDFYHDGYDWSEQVTYIDGNYIKSRSAGDGCGCGCDNHLYNYTSVIGRIKKFDTKSIRGGKLKDLGIK